MLRIVKIYGPSLDPARLRAYHWHKRAESLTHSLYLIMTGFIHFCAKNDYNGNPQRVFVMSDETGKFIAAWDEGYKGSDAVPGAWRDDAYRAQRYDVSVTKYKELLRTLPSPDYAYDVEGYSHLRNA